MANHNEVFLSFRGGTRYQFTDHLYGALRRNGIDTFRDNDRLNTGDKLDSVLMEAIENCKMAIAVLCEDYASSTWCLDELVKIIECHEKHGTQVLPIIYRVKPSDVWEHKGSYHTALAKHETRQKSETVNAWRLALSKVEKLTWLHCTEDAPILFETRMTKCLVASPLPFLNVPSTEAAMVAAPPTVAVTSIAAVGNGISPNGFSDAGLHGAAVSEKK
ncbi:hypothetical protein PIB30_051818 [Stylosanthes scabra]|uniref:TIR domain-containing protein n=1 Tax=Stylosanthes scabra TaxID=79078 RepID=A0ABU6WHV3_9FABA|nr:hypothetical protein [Stylosanthes scabra]